MFEEKDRVIGPILGEVNEKEMRVAEQVAQVLMQSNKPRTEVKVRNPDGREISGQYFEGGIVVTDEFIATTGDGNKIDQFLPRTRELKSKLVGGLRREVNKETGR